jgi:DNA primase
MSQVDEVRDRLDIVEVVGEYVQLKRGGRSWKGNCPFHKEKTPSFVVFPDSGNWRCFGGCATGGDVFDFVMRIENVDFKGALELLARRAGVDLAPPSPVQERKKAQRDRLREVTAAAAEFFQHQLLRSEEPGAAAAREYLAGRGFGTEACKRFGIGYAPDDWQRTGDALRRQGFDDELLLAAGLLRQRDDGRSYDYFRGRVTFAIRNLRGEPVAFGARTLDPEGVPKYLNSPQTDIFDKGRTLYGLDAAKKGIRDEREAVVVEGYTDVVRAHLAGCENVVASLGTALTEHQVLLLKRFAPRIVLALDADAAGQAATLRGLEVVQEAGGGDMVPMPTASGVVRFEHRMDVDLAVATLPQGRDPDDVIQDDPDAWRALIARARPVMEHLFVVLIAGLDLSDPRGKTTAVERLMPVIADIPEPVARSAWLSRLADLVRIDERTLAASLARAAAARKPRRPSRATQEGDGDAGGAAQPRWSTPTQSEAMRERATSRLSSPAPEAPSNASAESKPPTPSVARPPVDAPEAIPTDATPTPAGGGPPPPLPADTFLDEGPPPLDEEEGGWFDEGFGQPADGTGSGSISPLPDEPSGTPRAASRPPARPATPRVAASTPNDLASWLVGQLLLAPHRFQTLNRGLRDEDLPPLEAGDLERAMDRDLLAAIAYAAHGIAPPDAPSEHRLEQLPEAHAAYCAALRKRAAAEPSLAESEHEKAMRRTVLRLRVQATRQRLEGLRFLQAEAEAEERATLDARVREVVVALADLQRHLAPRGRSHGKRDRAVS